MVKLTKNQRTGLYLGAGAALVGAFVVRELIDYEKIKDDENYLITYSTNAALVGSSILLGIAIAAPEKTISIKL